MHIVNIKMIFAVALVLVLAATGIWASAAGEEEPAAAMEKEMVRDPATGKMVTAPEYGGTLTIASKNELLDQDPSIGGHWAGFQIQTVNEKLAHANWATPRDEWDFTSWYRPLRILTGWLAESWSNPDPQTFIVKVRQGVYWHDKPPVNGRELTAEDVAWTYRRIGGLLDWKPEYTYALRNFPWEFIEATDRYTVEFKLTEPRLDLPSHVLTEVGVWILPPETNPDIQAFPFYDRAFQVSGMNIRRPPFDDVRVRKAMNMAIDRDAINESYFGGYAYPTVQGWVGAALGEMHTPFEERPADLQAEYSYNPQDAERLLDEAGYARGAAGVRFKVTYDHRDVIDLGWVEIVAGYWKEIGVEVEITVMDTGAWVDRRARGLYEMSTGDHERVRRLHHAAALPGLRPQGAEFQLANPWVKGWNGERTIGDIGNEVLVRIWLDQDLKREMGY